VKNARLQRGHVLYVACKATTDVPLIQAKAKSMTTISDSTNFASTVTAGNNKRKSAIISRRRRRIALNSAKKSAELLTGPCVRGSIAE
jgi:hypothetical protein